MVTIMSDHALDGLKVLDASGVMGNYCTKLMAELGADVVLIEPLEGSQARQNPPFADGEPPESGSLSFFYSNTSKRSLSLDIAHPDGRDIFRRLALGADLVVEDHPPGYLAGLGLGAEDLLALNKRLVITSITPFGQQGPYAQYEHADLVCLALGGLLWMGGYADGPPVQAAGEQAYVSGNLFGAVASMIALTHAELHEEGQHVDVSVQEGVVMALENAAQFYDLEKVVRRRHGGTQAHAGAGVYSCADGDVFLLAGGIGGDRFWGNLISWLSDEGAEGVERLEGERWVDQPWLRSQEAKDVFTGVFGPFALGKRKEDLYISAQRWRVPLCPVNKPSDVIASRQLDYRGFFHEMEAFGRSFAMPGAPYQLSETPWQLRGGAPAVGEHTEEVLQEIGIGIEELQSLREAAVIR